MRVSHFAARFRIFYRKVGRIFGKLYCAHLRSEPLSFKIKNFSFLEATVCIWGAPTILDMRKSDKVMF